VFVVGVESLMDVCCLVLWFLIGLSVERDVLLQGVFEFLGEGDMCLCLQCSLLLFLVLSFVLFVVCLCLCLMLKVTMLCFHIQ